MSYVLLNIPHRVPKGNAAASTRTPLLFLRLSILSLPGNNWNMSRSRADLHDIFAEENCLSLEICLLSFVLSHSSA